MRTSHRQTRTGGRDERGRQIGEASPWSTRDRESRTIRSCKSRTPSDSPHPQSIKNHEQSSPKTPEKPLLWIDRGFRGRETSTRHACTANDAAATTRRRRRRRSWGRDQGSRGRRRESACRSAAGESRQIRKGRSGGI